MALEELCKYYTLMKEKNQLEIKNKHTEMEIPEIVLFKDWNLTSCETTWQNILKSQHLFTV